MISNTLEVTSSPRSLLEPSQCVSLDAVLKDLKTCTRRLQAAASSQQTELQVLRRLYYKGNNQHRTALFWRRVAEIRRYGNRLETLNIPSAIEALRLSFWGSPSERTAKSVKGAWTHAPDSKSVQAVLESLTLAHQITSKMKPALQRAYSHLNINLQTGAFLQLMLTLSAVVSRLSVLLDELVPSIEVAWDICYRLLSVIDGAQIRRVKLLAGRSAQVQAEQVVQSVLNKTTEDIPAEDVGDTVARSTSSRDSVLPSMQRANVDSEDIADVQPCLNLNLMQDVLSGPSDISIRV
ncbi:hypothetical protein K474DRAFT_1670903 [Panus rudis PR-1116 ss-1]|nr:hypothetical protein K474DRAFT_1670903 [Panus rudis PR-1116 ss-1]